MIDLRQGDALEVLRGLPDGAAQMCVTSPPYWNLRDYGTGTWEGGAAGCDHVERKAIDASRLNRLGVRPNRDSLPSSNSAFAAKEHQYREICGKCGAVRIDRQLGMERTLAEYIANLVAVFAEVKRVLRDDGTFWLNLGDSYSGSGGPGGDFRDGKGGDEYGRKYGRHDLPAKSLCMVPARVALALQANGWILRSVAPWIKRSAMPESVTDRPSSALEWIFLFAKSGKYYYDCDAVRKDATSNFGRGIIDAKQKTVGIVGQETKRAHSGWMGGNGHGRNRRNTDWFFESLGLLTDDDGLPLAFDVNPAPYKGSHFATFPPALVAPMVRAGTSERGCCSVCQVPYVRLVERSGESADSTRGAYALEMERLGRADKSRANGYHGKVETQTLGWRAQCSHDAPATPCTVLDPFAGSGTVGAVCLEHGRSFIGIELNLAYIELARERIGKVKPALVAV